MQRPEFCLVVRRIAKSCRGDGAVELSIQILFPFLFTRMCNTSPKLLQISIYIKDAAGGTLMVMKKILDLIETAAFSSIP